MLCVFLICVTWEIGWHGQIGFFQTWDQEIHELQEMEIFHLLSRMWIANEHIQT